MVTCCTCHLQRSPGRHTPLLSISASSFLHLARLRDQLLTTSQHSPTKNPDGIPTPVEPGEGQPLHQQASQTPVSLWGMTTNPLAHRGSGGPAGAQACPRLHDEPAPRGLRPELTHSCTHRSLYSPEECHYKQTNTPIPQPLAHLIITTHVQ